MTKEKNTLLNLIMYGASALPHYHYCPPLSDDIDYKALAEELNNFHHEILPITYSIEPIPDWNVPYGERELYQEVKAHLISQNSNRISASSKSVNDYRLQNGRENSIDPKSLDKVRKDLKEKLLALSPEEQKEALSYFLFLSTIENRSKEIQKEFEKDYWHYKYSNPQYYYRVAVGKVLSPLSAEELRFLWEFPI